MFVAELVRFAATRDSFPTAHCMFAILRKKKQDYSKEKKKLIEQKFNILNFYLRLQNPRAYQGQASLLALSTKKIQENCHFMIMDKKTTFIWREIV